ncbi:MAG TPA: hypothetical protein P5081_13275 [Phycisphaerae bacterium]|nr:hypothetical protein [Phycisphaerae bacterium]HRW53847.1 hypothetical protein [Phycisphaerae bacterium]
MSRLLATSLALCLSFVLTGCKAPTESEEATTAIVKMMPVGGATPEILYAVDQAEVKVLPEREISRDGLSVFREKLEEKRAAEAASMAKNMPASGTTMGDTKSGDAGSKSIWGGIRSLLGGKAPPDKGAASADQPASDSKEDAATADDSDATDNADDSGDDDGW